MPENQNLQERIDAVVAQYQPLIEKLQAEGQQMEQDFEDPNKVEAVINVDFDVNWEKTDIVFDIPAVRMKNHKVSFDIPEVSMNRKDMSFDTPSVKMVNKKVGEYPCFRGLKLYSCDIIMKVPEFFMERQDISMDIPEISMKRIEVKFDLPEFFMSRVNWTLHLPQFTVKSVTAQVRQIEGQANDLRVRADQLGAGMRAQIDAIMAGGFGQGAQTVIDSRNELAAPFDNAIATISKTIDELVAKKIDPVKIPANDGNINLRKTLEEVVQKRDETLAAYDQGAAPSKGSYLARHDPEPAAGQPELVDA